LSKNIKKAIKKYKHALKWKLETIQNESIKTLEIVSDKKNFIHRVYIPENDVRDIEFLHELGHAFLCENIHQLFSTSSFLNYNEYRMKILVPIVRAADDWFVDQWLFEIAPNDEKKEIEEHYKLVMASIEKIDSYEIMVASAFLIAQAERYLKIKPGITGDIRKLIDCFLNVNPEKPNVKKLEKLINSMLSLVSDFQVEVCGNDWNIKQEGELI